MLFDRQRFIADAYALAEKAPPWVHQGRDPDLGLDCVGAPRVLYEMQGLRLPAELEQEMEHYHRRPDGKRMLAIMKRWFPELTEGEMEPADLYLVFNRKNPCHIAIKMDIVSMVAEAFQSMDGAVSKFLIRELDHRYVIAGRFRIPDFV